MRIRLVFLAAMLGSPAMAQVLPQPSGGDPHLQQVDYDAGQIVGLRGSPGYQLMVELSPDEQIESVALGDSASWSVSVSKSGDRLFLKPAQAGVQTNMTVVTSVRVYNFDLASEFSASPDMPYTVEFRYPEPKVAAADGEYVDASLISRSLSRYRVSGDRLLWPTSITDDGQRTYILWPRTAAIPAVYAPDRFGREVLVNGMMTPDDMYVIDGAPQKLIFRIDSNVARAVRIKPKKKKR